MTSEPKTNEEHGRAPEHEGAPALELKNVTRDFGSGAGVRDVSFTLGRRELLAILGPSGCGKTTTLRLIAGFEAPDEGEIYLDGQVVATPARKIVPPRKRRVGMVFQNFALFPHMSVASNIAFGLSRKNRAERRARVAELLDLIELSAAADKLPHELSGGEQQRVALARALAPEPAVICLDEPFSDLDRSLRVELRREVKRLLAEAGTASVFVTHDQEEALGLADRIAVMRDGGILQIGDPATVYQAPVDRWVASFVGDGQLLPAVRAGDHLSTPVGQVVCDARTELPDAKELLVLVRPEWVKLGTPGSGGVDARVEDVEYGGAHSYVLVAIETGGRFSGTLTASVDRPPPAVGDRVSVTLDSPGLVVFAADE